MSIDLKTKIHKFLIEERHINASVVHQELEENPWIPQNELRSIVDQVVGYFEDAFEGISTFYDLGVVKTNKEKPLN
ncbi:hypothetical protein G9A89_004992 [Geosiphon pyriformis]|nr:hypothetical protein G9A89_004992 [Geosiphon pyriformis]